LIIISDNLSEKKMLSLSVGLNITLTAGFSMDSSSAKAYFDEFIDDHIFTPIDPTMFKSLDDYINAAIIYHQERDDIFKEISRYKKYTNKNISKEECYRLLDAVYKSKDFYYELEHFRRMSML
jgi:hypothetical protein